MSSSATLAGAAEAGCSRLFYPFLLMCSTMALAPLVNMSELNGRDPIETRAGLLAKRVNDLDVAADGRSGVVATDQLVAQALQ